MPGPTWLQNAHAALDRAVFAAYGWPEGIGDEDILKSLLALDTRIGARAGKVEALLRAHKGPRFRLILTRLTLPVSATIRREERRLTEVGDTDTNFDTNPVQQRETQSNANLET